MKVTEIEIKEFQQFKDFKLDLTYPKGHDREGEPLDKVCFIGQSGTGKTTLLKGIRFFLRCVLDAVFNINDPKISPFYEQTNFINLPFKITTQFNKNTYSQSKDNAFFANADHSIKGRDSNAKILEKLLEELEKYRSQQSNLLIYYPSEIPFHKLFLDDYVDNPMDYLATEEEIKEIIQKENERLAKKKSFDFEEDKMSDIWKIILSDASNYMVEELKYSQQITKSLIKSTDEAQQLIENFK